MAGFKRFFIYFLSFLTAVSPVFDASAFSKEIQEKSGHIGDFSFLEAYADIVETFHGQGDATVYCIEDIHAHLEAQKNIHRILNLLNRELSQNRPQAILLEGASGFVDTGVFDAMPSESVRGEIIRIFLEMGELSGAESFVLKGGEKRPLLWGMDDISLYARHLDVFKEALQKRQGDVQFLEKQKRELFSSLNAEQKNFFSRWERLAHGEISYLEFIHFLSEYFERFGLHLKPKGSIRHFLEIQKSSLKLNAEKIQAEIHDLLNKILALNNKEEIKPVIEKILAHRLGRLPDKNFLNDILKWTRQFGINFHSYSHLSEYYRVLQSSEYFDFDGLEKETEALAFQAAERLTAANTAGSLHAEKWRKLLLLEKLAQLQWRRQDFNSHKDSIPESFSIYREFYELALQRDNSLFENSLHFMKSRDLHSAAVVMGGFHRDSFAKQLRENKISYVILRPRFSAEEVDFKKYENLMTGRFPSRNLEGIFNLRLAVASRLMNALSNIGDIQRFNTLLSIYYSVCMVADHLDSGIKAETLYHDLKDKWVNNLKEIRRNLPASGLSAKEIRLREKGLNQLIRTVESFDVSFLDAVRTDKALHFPMLMENHPAPKDPLWVTYEPFEDAGEALGPEDLARILEQTKIGNQSIRFSHGPKVEVELAELIAGLLSSNNQNPDVILDHFWDTSLVKLFKPSQERIEYWEKLVGEFAKDVFPQKERPVVEIISNAITSLWKKEGEVPQEVHVTVDANGFRVKDAGAGMSLKEILYKLLIPGLSGTRGTEGIGQFGVGFYSILRYLNSDDDLVSVMTCDGTHAHRIDFFMKDKRVIVRITPLPASIQPQGTEVIVRVASNDKFDPALVEKTASNAFQFLGRGKIILNGRVVNEEVLDFKEYLGSPSGILNKKDFLAKDGLKESDWNKLIQKGFITAKGVILGKFDPDKEHFLEQMESELGGAASQIFEILLHSQSSNFFFSKKMAAGSAEPGTGKIYVVKDEVVLFELPVEGWAIPEQLIIKVPKFTRIPVERDKIEVGVRERAFFFSLIDQMAAHPQALALLSSFYPLVGHLQEWNSSPEKDDDLLKYFFRKVKEALGRTPNVLPDTEAFYKVYFAGISYLRAGLFERFQTNGVQLPPFEKWEAFAPTDPSKKIFWAVFSDPNVGMARFGNLILLSDQLKPDTALEKSIVYSLLNYNVTDASRNIPGHFVEPLPEVTIDLEPFRKPKAASLPAVPAVQSKPPQAVKSTEPFADSSRILKVVLRCLMRVGEGRLSMRGVRHEAKPADVFSLMPVLVRELNTIVRQHAEAKGPVALGSFLRFMRAGDTFLNVHAVEKKLTEMLESQKRGIRKTLQEMEWAGSFPFEKTTSRGNSLGKVLTDGQGVIYAFENSYARFARYSPEMEVQGLEIQVTKDMNIHDAEVSHDGKEFYFAAGDKGVLIFDMNGKLKERIDTGPLGEKLASQTGVQSISRAGENTLLLWDAERNAVLVLKRENVSSAWEFVRVIHTEVFIGLRLAGDESGNVYILDRLRNSIQGYDVLGQKVQSFSLAGSGQPVDLARDKEGHFWVVQGESRVIQKYSPDGFFMGEFGQGKETASVFLDVPKSIALLPDGALVVGDARLEQVTLLIEKNLSAPSPAMTKTKFLEFIHDFVLLAFLESYLKDESSSSFLKISLGTLLKDPERSALMQMWLKFRNLHLDEEKMDLRDERHLDVYYQLALQSLSMISRRFYYGMPADVGWIDELEIFFKNSPLWKWSHPEDVRFWVVYYKIRRALTSYSLSAFERFDEYFRGLVQKMDRDNFWKTLRLFEQFGELLRAHDMRKIFSSETNFNLFLKWLEKIGPDVFIAISPAHFLKMDGHILQMIQFMLDQETEIGSHRMGRFAQVFFKGVGSLTFLGSSGNFKPDKYLEVWQDWINVSFEKLEKDFDQFFAKKAVAAEREHYFFYLMHDDLDLDKIEEVKPLKTLAASRVISEKKFSLARFFAHFLEAPEAQRETLLKTDVDLSGLDEVEKDVANPLSLETAMSLLRNSISEQSVDPYVFIRELIQNSLDAARNARAFVVVNEIEEKDIPLDWRRPEVRERILYKMNQWIGHFRKDPEGYIEELSASSLESSRNAFAFGIVGQILTRNLYVDWRDPAMRSVAVNQINKWITEFEKDSEDAITDLLMSSSHEAMARYVIQEAHARGVELDLTDPSSLMEQIPKVVSMQDLEERFLLPSPLNPLRVANAIRRKFIDVELFKGGPQELAMTFSDAVGMSLSQILQFFLVPGVSSKPAKDPHADGRFGIGFYSSLKSAHRVEVYSSVGSSRGKEIVSIIFEPVRSRDGTIEDVQVTLSVKENPENFRGTRVIWKTHTQKFPLTASQLRTKVNEYAGTVRPSEMVLRWQKSVINQKLEILGEKDIPGLGTLTWYASPKKQQVITRRGMKVKSLNADSDIFQQVPRGIAESILRKGLVAELPRRTPLTRSRDDMASKEQYLELLQRANAALALEVATRSFLEGSMDMMLDMLPYDYLQMMIRDRRYQPQDAKIIQDAVDVGAGKLIDMSAYIDKNKPFHERNKAGHRLVQLLTVLPVVENPDGSGRLSLAELIHRVDQKNGNYDAAFLDSLRNKSLAKRLKDAFENEKQRKIKEKAVQTILSRPEASIQNLELPILAVAGFDAYWAFNQWLVLMSKALWRAAGRTDSVDVLYRMEDSGNYAYGGEKTILINLLVAGEDIETWGKFLRGELKDNAVIMILHKFFEVIAHEMAHLLEPPGMGTHHEQFYDIERRLILLMYQYRKIMQKMLDIVKGAGYKGEYQKPHRLEPHLIVTNKGPTVVKKLQDERSLIPVVNTNEVLKKLLEHIRNPAQLNAVFWRLAANIAKEGSVKVQFTSSEEALLFLRMNPSYQEAMSFELARILHLEEGAVKDKLDISIKLLIALSAQNSPMRTIILDLRKYADQAA